MDNAVALVQAYLRVNGYFTVTEYPVVEAMRSQQYRQATDLDVLAFRFPGAGRAVPGESRKGERSHPEFAPDPVLIPDDREPDMIIGEVKEGAAELNTSASRKEVLAAALTRFGCCSAENSREVIERLMRDATAATTDGHQLRIVAFGSKVDPGGGRAFQQISLGHVLDFLKGYISDHWTVLRHAQFRDPVFSFLVLQEKIRRVMSGADEEPESRSTKTE